MTTMTIGGHIRPVRTTSRRTQPRADTPDDLLDKLLDIDRRDAKTADVRLSELALEHAARRVGLIKKHGVSDSVVGQRKKGVRVSGSSNGHLFEFLKQGREYIAKAQANQEA